MADKIMRAGTELSAIVPELWSAKFYPTLLAKLPFNDVVSRDYEGEIRALGDTVNISSFPQFDDAQEIAEDERVDADSITAAGQQLVINKQVVKDYIVTNRAQIQSLEHANALRDLAMHAIMKKMQKVIIDAIVPSAAAPDNTIGYTSGTTLALADILAAKELLDNQDVPDANRQLVVGPAQLNDLFNITGFVSRDFIPAGSPLQSGGITSPLLGFDVKWTSVLSANVSYLFHPQFMGLAVQQNPEVKVFDLGVDGRRAERVNMTVLFGLKQLDDKRVVTIA